MPSDFGGFAQPPSLGVDGDLCLLGGLEISPIPSNPPVKSTENTDVWSLFKNLSEKEVNVAVVSALLAAAVSNAVPDPSDGLYLWGQLYLKEANRKGKLKDWQSLAISLGTFYIPAAAWYGLLALIAIKTPGIEKKLTTVGTIAGVGAIIGISSIWLFHSKH